MSADRPAPVSAPKPLCTLCGSTVRIEKVLAENSRAGIRPMVEVLVCSNASCRSNCVVRPRR